MGWQIRVPLRAQKFVSYACCVGSGLCDEPISRSEESYRCVFVCVGVCVI